MKTLQTTLLSLLFTCFSFLSNAQDGFDVIRKAERKATHGQYEKALKLLEQADTMSYGFCLNAWWDANRSINLLRAQIYTNTKAYQLARNSLDSIRVAYNYDNFDSIRLKTYQLEFGSDNLCAWIDDALAQMTMNCSNGDCFAQLPLANGQIVRLKLDPYDLSISLGDQEKITLWKAQFKASSNYSMVKEWR